MIDYPALAAELRKGFPPPHMEMSPGTYMDSLGIHSLADAIERVGKQAKPTPQPPQKPTIGRIVLYTSKVGDGIVSPAIVLRTRDTTNLEIIERWGPSPDGTLSGKWRPAALVAQLPDDCTVDLLVHGLGGDYREFCVPMSGTGTPGSWDWPPRI